MRVICTSTLKTRSRIVPHFRVLNCQMLWFHCAATCQLKHYFLRMRNGRYVAPSKPGYSAEMFPESIAKYSFPDGEEWRSGA
jgi:hypothetical protein